MKLVEFDGITLPLFDATQDMNAARADSSLLESVGSVFDFYDNRQRLPRLYNISAEGTLIGETTYLVDEAGNRLVDDAGNALIAGTPGTHLRSQIQALRSRVGVRGSLWRQRLDDSATREWITARCVSVDWNRNVDERTNRAVVRCQFESAMTAWRAASATTTTVSASAGVETPFVLSNGGDVTIDDAIIAIARTSGTITAVTVNCAQLGISWTWGTGSIGAGQTLTVDAGARTVRRGTTNVYSAFSLNSGHTARGWLPIPPGTYSFTVLCTGGAATVTVTRYTQSR